MNRVIVVGSTNMDLIAYCKSFPKPGETILGKSFEQGFGGKGANQCVMASLFKDVETVMVCSVGNDTFGDAMIKNFNDLSIDTSYIIRTEAPTGCAQISVDEHGQNNIIVIPGANYYLPQIDRIGDLFQKNDVVVCQNEIPLQSTFKALEMAKNRGCTTIWNPAPAPELNETVKNILKCTDIVIVNETEAKQLADNITRGSKGCTVFNDKETEIQAEKVIAVDATGAGDAFVGSFSRCIAIGKNSIESSMIACKIAGDSVTRNGTQKSYPRLNQIQVLLSGM
ncbi:Ribokinase [Entamoeba marina]